MCTFIRSRDMHLFLEVVVSAYSSWAPTPTVTITRSSNHHRLVKKMSFVTWRRKGHCHFFEKLNWVFSCVKWSVIKCFFNNNSLPQLTPPPNVLKNSHWTTIILEGSSGILPSTTCLTLTCTSPCTTRLTLNINELLIMMIIINLALSYFFDEYYDCIG